MTTRICLWDCTINHAHRLDALALAKRQGTPPWYFGADRNDPALEAAWHAAQHAGQLLADSPEELWGAGQ